MLGLRNYQEEALRAIELSLRAGRWSQVLVYPTGAGKTVTVAHLPIWLTPWLRQWPRARMLFVAHREELLDQAAATISAVNPHLLVGVEQADRRTGPMHDVVVASIQTLASRGLRRLHALGPQSFRIVVCDECFPAGTLVDGRPIEDVCVGDVVACVDVKTGAAARRRVVRTIRLPVVGRRLVTLRLWNGEQLTATDNHPIWTAGGWVSAGAVHHGMFVMYHDGHVQDYDLFGVRHANRSLVKYSGSVLRIMSRTATRVASKACDVAMRGVRGIRRVRWANWIGSREGWPGVLFSGASRSVACSEVSRDNGEHQSSVCVSENDGAQSDAQAIGSHEGVSSIAASTPQTTRARWEWPRANASATAVSEGARMADGSDYPNEDEARQRVSDTLQGRYRQRSIQDCRGSRWQQSLRFIKTSARRPERPVPTWARVDSVEIHEQSRVDESSILCGDGYVYNLEVAEYHTYFANGILVSNCHHVTAESYKTVFGACGLVPPDELKPGPRASSADAVAVARHACQAWWAATPAERLFLGITATPNRADGVGLEWSFQSIVYERSLRAMIAQGWLVEPRGYFIDTQTNLDHVHTVAGDFNQGELAEAVNTPRRNLLAVEGWKRLARSRDGQVRPTLAFCVDIQHAQDLSAMFRAHGVNAQWASGEVRDGVGAFKDGAIDVLCSCNLVTEGFDHPPAAIALMARPTKSRTLYQQMAGRILRIAPDKPNALIVDCADISQRHSLMTSCDLFGLPVSLNPGGQSLAALANRLDAVQEEFPGISFASIASVADIDQRIQQVDLWTVRESALVAQAALSWVEMSPSRLQLSWPRPAESGALTTAHDRVVLTQNLLGAWQADHYDGATHTRQPIGSGDTIERVIVSAETWLHANYPNVVTLKARDAAWRQRSASPKQIQLLKRLGASLNYETLTRGAASALLDQYFASRKRGLTGVAQ